MRGLTDLAAGTLLAMEPPRRSEHGRVRVMFFPGCLVLSIALSIVGTILLNLLLRALS